ncbi:MAG: HD domain-containing protein [Anaerolineales bacterium]|nr:HD domain-containing protein [Anaerolineales bacterium]
MLHPEETITAIMGGCSCGAKVLGEGDCEACTVNQLVYDYAARQQQLTRETERQFCSNRLEAIEEVADTICTSNDLFLILNILLDRCATHLNVPAAAVMRLTSYNVLTYAAGRGFRSKTIKESKIPLGQSFAGRAAKERRIFSINDLQPQQISVKFMQLFAMEGFNDYMVIPLVAMDKVLGVLEIFHHNDFTTGAGWLNFLAIMADLAALAIYKAELLENQERANIELEVAYGATLEGWMRALELRDRYTEDHSQRVIDLTLRLATTLGVPNEELVHITRGGMLHDIGKMAIPDDILLKEGPLTKEEWEVMREHPRLAYELLNPIRYLHPALDIPYCHHERWDGSGYPRALKNDEIPLSARIFMVVDVWDALLSDRPYRPAWPAEKAIDYIETQAGKQFDPDIVRTFIDLIRGEPIPVESYDSHANQQPTKPF